MTLMYGIKHSDNTRTTPTQNLVFLSPHHEKYETGLRPLRTALESDILTRLQRSKKPVDVKSRLGKHNFELVDFKNVVSLVVLFRDNVCMPGSRFLFTAVII